MNDTEPLAVRREAIEDIPDNASANPTMGEIIAERLSRRDAIKGALAVSVMAGALPASAIRTAAAATPTPTFDFPELTAASTTNHAVAEGYRADVLIRWGDAVLPGAPAFDPENQTPEAQAAQFGYNNDFVGFVPLDETGDRALLVVNHEYVSQELMFPGLGDQEAQNFADVTRSIVDTEMMAHGGSVIEIRRGKRPDGSSQWRVVENSRLARRITAQTPMRISGPAAGHNLMKTKADPDGKTIRGTLNNCAGGVTPWGTWLTCEENFNLYFLDSGSAEPNAANARYGVPKGRAAWGWFHDRFDITKEPNEPNRFGWVVEIDPKDPTSTPVKRTAMGRFKHEGAGNIVNRDGRFVVYQGDDQRFDYVYRFVTNRPVDLENPAANQDILDDGTLYVARFNGDGTGIWLPIQYGQGPLTEASGFRDQGEVLIKARMAADLLGATKMDRPEDVDANPETGKVYVMLTDNKNRPETATNAANPRAKNRFGHIIEIDPAGGDHAAPSFSWGILVKCGDPAVAEVGATFNPETSENGWFANPDNCAIDAAGRLWIATDGNSADKTGRTDGLWAMETAGDARGTSKLFYRCPVGAEMCGPCPTPDLETFFVAVQHPGEAKGRSEVSTYDFPSTRWPDFKDDMPPRPAIVAITRKGGGRVAG